MRLFIYLNIYIYIKENFYLVHNNTKRTISNAAKSSILIVNVYHLKS